MDMLQWNL